VDPINEFNVALQKQFETINKKDVNKKKQFISDLLTESCDED
jgi:hypothetical protein